MFDGKFNLGNIASLMKNAGKIQEMMKEAQEKLAKIEVIGEAGAGAVQIKMNAQGYALAVHIDDDILKEDKIILQDLIAAAINDGTKKIEKEKEKLVGGAGMLNGMLSEEEK
ncbi:MAG: nucleoid-associated protein, YbaB/EbfC family [Gammaproteobacteria bacterium RIFCSPHIGHO2_12_FULL_40_19]|nr:MAG: nucleoid-associated protein, YbaB/EbfC family [Gammaproteobacteria bacterium RIFCSPHIGHO2_12_FULL_40_19]